MELIEYKVSVIAVQSEFQTAYDFEVYDVLKTVLLFKRYRPVLYVLIGLYLGGIYFGQKWMKNRPAHTLKYPLFVWNVGLALFSIIATIRAYPQFIFLLSKPDRVYRIICTADVFNYAASFWGLMFVLSKIVELGDTAFIVLRKQKLIFLHWYHHLTMLVMSWLGYEVLDTSSNQYILNTFVHSIMYSYFALKTLKVRVPKCIAMLITGIQISQFVIGISWNAPSFYWIAKGVPCARDPSFLAWVLLIGTTYLLLFIHFFVQAYLVKKKKTMLATNLNSPAVNLI